MGECNNFTVTLTPRIHKYLAQKCETHFDFDRSQTPSFDLSGAKNKPGVTLLRPSGLHTWGLLVLTARGSRDSEDLASPAPGFFFAASPSRNR